MNFLIGFEISYNNLNLPTVIYTEGDMGLYYTYLSDGTKIKVCGYDDNEPTRYAGSLVYNDGTFESASFGGGRIVGTNNGANSEVHYFLTDHLGSVRGAHVQSRLGSMVHAGSVGGEVLFVGAILLLHK